MPGGVFAHYAEQYWASHGKYPLLFQTDTASYASRISPNREISIVGAKKKIAIACTQRVPSDVQEKLASIFDPDLDWVPMPNILFQRLGCMFHPTTVYGNRDTLHVPGLFYEQLLPNAAAIAEAADAERVITLAALTAKRRQEIRTALDIQKERYGDRTPPTRSIGEHSQWNAAYQGILGPVLSALPHHRYLLEDLVLLSLLRSIAAALGVQTPTLTTIIDWALTKLPPGSEAGLVTIDTYDLPERASRQQIINFLHGA